MRGALLLCVWRLSYASLCRQGTGNIRSYGKRVVSEEWSAIEPWSNPLNTSLSAVMPGALYSSSGYYGNSRFLTQLRTGFTITACGQTRTVNAIHSDVEMTVDRPFTNGNREFFRGNNSATTARALAVRGLSRTLPLWPRGVTVQIIVKAGGNASVAKFIYNVWWKTFVRTADGGGGGISMNTAAWTNLQDVQLQQFLGVYIRWDSAVTYTVNDEWRLHVGDVQNCPWLISAEGERYINDDNANPPVCYNHGSCTSISSGAQSAADGSFRPVIAATGNLTYNHNTGIAMSSPVRLSCTSSVQNSLQLTLLRQDSNKYVSSFTTTLSPGMIVRALVNNNPTDMDNVDLRVTEARQLGAVKPCS